MQQRPHRRSRARWAPYVLGPVAAVALVVGAAVPVVVVAPSVSGATTGSGGSLSGSFTGYLPGEQWGGGNPAEKCVSCTATSVIGEDTAQSIQQGQPVSPATGDFTTHVDLLSVPTAAGTFGLDLTYDAQRAISEGIDPSGYPYQDPGPFGWGWQSALSASLVNGTHQTSVQVNEANGSQLEFHAIGTTTGDIDADECPWRSGFYPDWQKTTAPGSTVAYCAASRVNAQVGTDTFHTYHLRVDGGTEDLTFDYFGQLTEDGNLQNPGAVTIVHGATQGHTGCPNVGPATTTCDIENDTVAQSNGVTRRIVTEIDGVGVATTVFAPTGAQYTLGHNGDALLTSVIDPTGDVTHYGYAATGGTQSTGYKNEMTSITDPDANTSTIVYATGMVTELSDPNNQETRFSYSTTTCGTLSGCFKTDTSQATTVTYDDGETDRDYYEGGVMLTDCYGPSTDTCGNGADWGFNYLFDTGGMAGGTNKETVNMPEGAQATIVTDAAGNVVAYTDPAGYTTHEMWNDTGRNDLGELCWSLGAETSVPASATCTRPKSLWSSSYTYNGDGERLSVANQRDDVTHYGYYDNGLLCWTAPPSVAGGGTCANGGNTPSGAPAGATAYRYNAESDLTQKTVAYGTGTVQTTTYNYDLDGRVTDVIPPDGQGHGGFGANPYETATTYRASGLVQTTAAPDGLTTAYTYDADGNVVTETTPSGVTTTTYDRENRVCWTHLGTAKVTGSCTSPPSGSTSTTYLATTSAPTTVTNQEGQTTTYTYADAVYPTRATETADPMGDEVTYAAYTLYGQTCISGPANPGANDCTGRVAGDTWADYNPEGQLLSTADPGGTPTSYTYGDADFPTQPTKVTYGPSGDSRTTTYSYLPNGDVDYIDDAEGHTTTVGYNTDGELCMVGPETWFPVCTPPPATGATQYTYDAAGERTSMTDNYGTASAVTDHYTYDPTGHLLSATTDNGRTTSYQYNDAGQVTCIAYPVKSGANCANGPSASNTVVDHTFNAAGELDKTTDWLGNALSYSGYTPKGEVGQVTYPSTTGESLSYHYNTAGEMTGADYSGPAVGSADVSFGQNDDAQLSSVTGLGGFTSSDVYNDYGRVTRASSPTAFTRSTRDTFTYNTDGTIASIAPRGGTTQEDTYNTLEELTAQSAVTVPAGKQISTVGTPTAVGPNPVAVAVAPNGSSTYVVDIGRFLRGENGALAVVTGTTGDLKSVITAGYAPTDIVINSAGTKAYVTVAGTDEVLPITLSTGAKETPIHVETDVISIALTPNGAKAYVASQSTNNVIPITLSAGTTGTPIAVGTDPGAIAITPEGTTAYVANCGSHSVTPITLSTNTAGSAITVGSCPAEAVVNPAGTKAYVTEGPHTVVPITLSTKTKESAITVGTGPQGIVLTPEGTTAFVATGSTVSTVTLLNDVTVTQDNVGTDLEGLAITSDGRRLYATDEGNTSVVPITLTTRDASATYRDSYTADGERCWSAPSTASAPCTAAPANATSYGWNHYDQLCWSGQTADATAGCTAPPTGTTTYKYNGTGLRTKETPPTGSTLEFTYDTVTASTPQDIDDGTYAYIYGPTGTAPVEEVNLSTGAASFLSSAPTGVQTVFSSSGSLEEEAAYSPYGTQVIQQGSKATPFGFQGTYQDPSGLDYMVNRYYTPTSAEFLSVDPDLTQTGQPYAFTGDDPLNETDPLGLKGWYCTEKTGKSNFWKGTKYGLANGKCGAGTTTKYARTYRAAVFATEYEEAAAYATEYLNHELAIVEQAYAMAWARANQSSCSSTTQETLANVTSCTVSDIVQAKGFNGCAVTAHGGGCYTQWYAVGQQVTPQDHIWVTKNTLEPLGSMDGCDEGAAVGGVAASESGPFAALGAVGGCIVGVGVDYVGNRFIDWLGSR